MIASRIRNMTEGKPAKLIFAFALPLMLGNVFQQLYSVIDAMVIGQVMGVSALAALGICDWYYWMILGVIQGISQGFSILMAQKFGAGDNEGLRKTVGNAVTLSVIISAVLLVASESTLTGILKLLNTPDTIMSLSRGYLGVMFLGIPILMFYNTEASILRALGDGKTPLRAMVIACAINIPTDIIFVAVFKWGVVGAAMATILAQLIAGVYCFRVIKKIEILKLDRSDYRIEKRLAIKLLKLGAPMALQNAVISSGGMILQSKINGFGVSFIAGITATNKLYGTLEIAATSYGFSMVTYSGQNLGAGKIERVRKGMRAATGIAIITSAVIGAIMIVFGKLILGCFVSGTEEETNEALRIAYRYLTVMSSFLPILYILHVTRSALQGVGDTVLPMVSGFAEFAMRTSSAFFLPALFGEEGLFFAEILAWVGADIILVSSYFVKIRQLRRQFGDKKECPPFEELETDCVL